MELIVEFLDSFWSLTGAMAPYLLFGFFFAGILHEAIPGDFIKKHLGKGNISSVIKATLFGTPLPVCSCGVIPVATALKKEGASKGSVLSFLISTPITGVDSILATFGIFGFAFTVYRVLTSILIAVTAGILSNIFDKEKQKTPSFSLSPANPNKAFFIKTPQKETKKRFSLKNAFKYGFLTLFGDIAKPLFWGLVIGALITVSIPDSFERFLSSHYWISYLGVIAVSVPMYVCATSSLPIAASLVLSGVSLGAAFVFLSAGPATNTVTMGVVKKMLGKRSLFIYLGVIIVGSVVFGVLLDMLFESFSLDHKNIIRLHEKGGVLEVISSVILYGFLLYFFIKPYFRKEKSCCTTG